MACSDICIHVSCRRIDAYCPQSVSTTSTSPIRTLVVKRDQECCLESQHHCCGIDIWDGPNRNRVSFKLCVVHVIVVLSTLSSLLILTISIGIATVGA